RALLDATAIDTEDLTCGGTAENNNVWGQGKLDAFAAVDQSPRGDSGQLAGTVTDAVSGDPIGGATVSMTGPVDRQRTTDPDGGYQITLPVGEYQVTASAFGYTDSTAQAEILAGQTTVQDFALQPVDSVTISGTVTDGSGHGWPLYAHIQVSGAPIPDVYTDPLTGAYSLSVPEGLTVTLTVNALSPGYNPETREVTAEPGGVVEDFALTVESACTALGYDLLPVEEGVGSGAGGHTLEVRPVAATDPAPQAIGEGSLTTLFASNNGFAGNTFDIEPTVPLVIRGFDVNIS